MRTAVALIVMALAVPLASQDSTVIQSYQESNVGACTARPDVQLRIDRAPTSSNERVLIVEYPVPSGDPAARDVQCPAVHRDWTNGRAIAFDAKADHALRLSVSFLDRNRVAYTTWTELQAGVWQIIRIPFDQMRPNPFFQPPDAKTGAPIDVSDVRGSAFAPQDKSAGRLTIGRFVVSP